MNRREFLSQLKNALENKLSADEIKKNMDYYGTYIDDEVKKGQSEEEVIAALGDPWALAKTILISSEMKGQEYYSYSEKEPNGTGSGKADKPAKRNDWNKILVLVVIGIIVLTVLSMLMGILAFVIRYAVPILIIVIIIKMLRKK